MQSTKDAFSKLGPTSMTLLERIRGGEPEGDRRFRRLYTPAVYVWLSKQKKGDGEAVAPDRLAEVTEKVIEAALKKIGDRALPGEGNGGLRACLLALAEVRKRWDPIDQYRDRRRHPERYGVGVAGADACDPTHAALDPSPDPVSESVESEELQEIREELVRIRRAMALVARALRRDGNGWHWRVFRRTVTGGEKPKVVAASMGRKAHEISTIKYRVRSRIERALEEIAHERS